jgi:hypothetical protein
VGLFGVGIWGFGGENRGWWVCLEIRVRGRKAGAREGRGLVIDDELWCAHIGPPYGGGMLRELALICASVGLKW